MPSAPARAAARASASEATFASTAMVTPSRVVAGRVASARSAAAVAASSSACARKRASTSGAGSTTTTPFPPSTTTVTPSGAVSSWRVGADNGGDPLRPGEDGDVRRRTAAYLHDGVDGRPVHVRDVRRCQRARDHHTGRDGSYGRCTEQAPQHLVADTADVLGPRPQVGVGQRRPLRLDVVDARGPRRSGTCTGVDALAHVGQQLGVPQQHQVRIEDARLLAAGLAYGDRAQPLDLATHLRDRLDQPAPLGRRWFAVGRVVGRRRRRGGEPAQWPDADPR